jgi:hypothetical protein
MFDKCSVTVVCRLAADYNAQQRWNATADVYRSGSCAWRQHLPRCKNIVSSTVLAALTALSAAGD